MLRDFNRVKYVPILAVKPAELRALEELPEKDKNILLPLIPLRGWVNAYELQNTLDKVEKCYGQRPWIADIDREFLSKDDDKRPIFKQIKDLLVHKNGYQSWCQFIEEHTNLIPVVQLAEPSQLQGQVERLSTFDRGLVVRFTEPMLPSLEGILKVFSTMRVRDLLVVLDFGACNAEILTRYARIEGYISSIFKIVPEASVAISASSFPFSFAHLGDTEGEQKIFEREIFNQVKGFFARKTLIYSDRGSARAKEIGGGGGTVPARLDYPLQDKWIFFRRQNDDYEAGYQDAAEELVKKDFWNPDLGVWGTRMIEITSAKKGGGIISPMMATAVRINMHLHQQLYYGAPPEVLNNTDDDWVD